jgi:hypothetical protein
MCDIVECPRCHRNELFNQVEKCYRCGRKLCDDCMAELADPGAGENVCKDCAKKPKRNLYRFNIEKSHLAMPIRPGEKFGVKIKWPTGPNPRLRLRMSWGSPVFVRYEHEAVDKAYYGKLRSGMKLFFRGPMGEIMRGTVSLERCRYKWWINVGDFWGYLKMCKGRGHMMEHGRGWRVMILLKKVVP